MNISITGLNCIRYVSFFAYLTKPILHLGQMLTCRLLHHLISSPTEISKILKLNFQPPLKVRSISFAVLLNHRNYVSQNSFSLFGSKTLQKSKIRKINACLGPTINTLTITPSKKDITLTFRSLFDWRPLSHMDQIFRSRAYLT